MHRLIAKQLAKTTGPTGDVDVDQLATLVGAAYDEFDRDRRRTDRSMSLMIEEVDAVNRNLEQLVAKRSSELQAREQDLQAQNLRFDIAINNMMQGLLLFDSSERLIVCNRRYIDIYGLSAEMVKPGISLRDLLLYRKGIGSFNGDVDEYCTSISRSVTEGKVSSHLMETPDRRCIMIVTKPVASGGWVATHEDITERRRAEEQIRHLAHHDGLTDLPNRALFHERLEEELARATPDQQLAVLYIDIDEFKNVNDTLGHLAGDALLKSVAAGLTRMAKAGEFVARIGGDEFAVICVAVRHADEITDLAAQALEAIRTPFECFGHQISADASIGIALAPQHGTDLDRLLRNADIAMYAAKSTGRRTWRLFDPQMDARARARRLLEANLREAIAEAVFEVHYQPCVDLHDNNITGCEALVRWRHPERGMISPAEFIPVAEETGLINQLGEWVLNTACKEAMTWPDDVKLAVNVSPVQLRSGTLHLKIASALAASGLPAHRLEVEITEAVLIRDDDSARVVLHQLRELGVRIALDDFGTGYSSLSYLQRFPFDKIKIDRSFVNDITNRGGSSVVQAVVNIAAARDMMTLAEGVETTQQRELLRALGCTEMQGFLFSPAIPATELRRMLLSGPDKAVALKRNEIRLHDHALGF